MVIKQPSKWIEIHFEGCFLILKKEMNYAIDVNFQKQRYGQRALRELCELLKLKYNAKWITTTYKHCNEIARRMYERVGFVQTDVVCENDVHEVNMILYL